MRTFLLCCASLLIVIACAASSAPSVGTRRGPFHSPATRWVTFEPELVDDYLPNPGIGWQEGRTLAEPILPETVAYRRAQLGWDDQNPDDGAYDWTAIDDAIDDARQWGKQLSFRVYTMRGERFGGHRVPQWVLDLGAVIREDGDPDYSNCVYQREWTRFVEEMRLRYDGNSAIAFVDISGYGQFNEWSWGNQTHQSAWSLDGQARRRLADAFIGGSGEVECRTADGGSETVSYDYPGFRSTQLVMPFAGIASSSEYVAGRRPDVGIRHDCLGSTEHTDYLTYAIGDLIDATWRSAPIVYEFCPGTTADGTFMAAAAEVLQRTHGSAVHDNLEGERSVPQLEQLLKQAGYRFALREISYPGTVWRTEEVDLGMVWQNLGYAPAYPRMCQDFVVHAYLVDGGGQVVQDWPLDAVVADWMPADSWAHETPRYETASVVNIAPDLDPGAYRLQVAIIDHTTGRPIRLAIAGRTDPGRYDVGEVSVQ